MESIHIFITNRKAKMTFIHH